MSLEYDSQKKFNISNIIASMRKTKGDDETYAAPEKAPEPKIEFEIIGYKDPKLMARIQNIVRLFADLKRYQIQINSVQTGDKFKRSNDPSEYAQILSDTCLRHIEHSDTQRGLEKFQQLMQINKNDVFMLRTLKKIDDMILNKKNVENLCLSSEVPDFILERIKIDVRLHGFDSGKDNIGLLSEIFPSSQKIPYRTQFILQNGSTNNLPILSSPQSDGINQAGLDVLDIYDSVMKAIHEKREEVAEEKLREKEQWKAEEKRKEEEEQRKAEEKRKEEEEQRKAEEEWREGERKRAEKRRKEEEERRKAEKKQREEEERRKAEEEWKEGIRKRAEKRRKEEEEQRKAEEKRKEEEEQRKAEEEWREGERKRVEKQRKEEEERRQEERKRVEKQRKEEEEQREAEEKRKIDSLYHQITEGNLFKVIYRFQKKYDYNFEDVCFGSIQDFVDDNDCSLEYGILNSIFIKHDLHINSSEMSIIFTMAYFENEYNKINFIKKDPRFNFEDYLFFIYQCYSTNKFEYNLKTLQSLLTSKENDASINVNEQFSDIGSFEGEMLKICNFYNESIVSPTFIGEILNIGRCSNQILSEYDLLSILFCMKFKELGYFSMDAEHNVKILEDGIAKINTLTSRKLSA